MKLAIAKQGDNVSGHFGHCEGFEIITITNDKVVDESFIQNPGHKPGFLPKFLKSHNINCIIAGGMGKRAQDLFSDNGIEVIVGATGNIENVINQYFNNDLVSTNSVCHEHEHAGDCSEH